VTSLVHRCRQADISMAVARLETLGVPLTPFSAALEELHDEVLGSRE